MFTTDTDIFSTRIENPTERDFCVRGLPCHPMVKAKSTIDVKGVYTKTFRDEWYNRAIAAGLKFKVFSTIPAETVKSLSNLPAPELAKAVLVKQVDPDTLPKADPNITVPVIDLEHKNSTTPFKTAQAAAEGREESLPAGVVKLEDLRTAEEANTIDDSTLFKRMTEKPIMETIAAPILDDAPEATADSVKAAISAKGPATKGGKKRSWLGKI